jgi:hypothetical protein
VLFAHLAVAVAEGADFLQRPEGLVGGKPEGKPVLKSGDVLFIQLEDALPESYLQYVGYTKTRGQIHLVDEKVSDPQTALERLEATIRSLPNLRLVIVDPIYEFDCATDKDNAREVRKAMNLLRDMALRHKICIAVCNWGRKRFSPDRGDSTLGSVAYRGVSDSIIYVERQGETSQRVISAEGRGVRLEATLLMFHEDEAPNDKGELEFADYTERVWLGRSVQEQRETQHGAKEHFACERREKAIEGKVFEQPGIFKGDLAEAVGGNRKTALADIDRMESERRLRFQPNGKAICVFPAISTEEVAPNKFENERSLVQ